MKKLASFNLKGGTGKSTIAVQVAHGLAKADYRVLLLDLDSQNDCSLFLGMEEDDYQKTFFDLIDYRHPAPLADCIIQARPNLDLLPNSRYAVIERDFHREPRIDILLEEKLAGLEDFGYDYLIIDCSPSRGVINDAVLYYTDGLIIPVQLEAASIRGIAEIFNYITELKLDPGIIKLVVPNMFDVRTNETRYNLEKLRSIFNGQDILADPIYRRIKIAEATRQGATIYEYDADAEKQFYDLLQRVVAV